MIKTGSKGNNFFNIWSKAHSAAFELANMQSTHTSDYKGNCFLKTGLTPVYVKKTNGAKCKRNSQKMSDIIEE